MSSFYDYINNDVLIKLIFIYFITLIFASSFNNYKYGRYRSGFCYFSIRLPGIINLILFLFPYKKKIPIGIFIAQIVTYIYAIFYVCAYNCGLSFDKEVQATVVKIFVIFVQTMYMLTIIDSLLHTDALGQHKSSKLSSYFRKS